MVRKTESDILGRRVTSCVTMCSLFDICHPTPARGQAQDVGALKSCLACARNITYDAPVDCVGRVMVFIFLSAVFVFLAVHHALYPPGDKRFDSAFFIFLLVAAIIAIFPLRQYFFEAKLVAAVEKLTHRYGVAVTCQSRLGSFFHYNKLGYVRRGDYEINLRPDMCSHLRSYIGDPNDANKQALRDYDRVMALHVLTHEAMHINQEYDEVKADCQAYQRNHKMAEHLGVTARVAAQSAIVIHRFRSDRHPYYSNQCEPGRALDEKLAGAVWRGPDK